MKTVRIPRNMTKGTELVVIPLKEYENLRRGRREIRLTKAQKKAIEKAREEIRKGNYVKWADLRNELVR